MSRYGRGYGKIYSGSMYPGGGYENTVGQFRRYHVTTDSSMGNSLPIEVSNATSAEAIRTLHDLRVRHPHRSRATNVNVIFTDKAL